MIEFFIAFTIALLVAGMAFTLFGLWVFVMLCKSLAAPADESNRINRIRLFWFALTRPELFVPCAPWLKNDELDNVKGVT